MDWKKLVGYGVGIYVVMFMFWSLLVAFEQGEAQWGWYASFVVLAVVAHLASAKLCTKNPIEIIKYSAGWVVIMAVLDWTISARFAEAELFTNWELYVGYAILLLAPLTVIFCTCKICCKDKLANVEEKKDDNQQSYSEPAVENEEA